MKKIKRLNLLMLCTVLLCSLWTVSAAAEEEKEVYSQIFIGNTFYYTVENGEATITSGTANGDVVVPANLGGYPVKKIGENAFADRYSIKKLTIQEGIEEIGDYAFTYYTEDGDDKPSTMTIKSLSLPSTLKKIGKGAFEYTNIEGELILPEGLEYISERAFNASWIGGTLNIPKSLQHMEDRAFAMNNFDQCFVDENNSYYCHDEKGNLYSKDKTRIILATNLGCESEDGIFIIPDGVEVIGYACFAYRSAIKEVIIPDSVTEIGGDAFYLCRSLEKLIIPKSVKKIGAFAFDGDANRVFAREIYYEGTQEEWNSIELGTMAPGFLGVHFSYADIVHTYSDEITSEPSCKWQGWKNCVCACGFKYQASVPSINENHSAYYYKELDVPATKEKNGTLNVMCEKCGIIGTDTIWKIGRVEVNKYYGYTGENIKPVPRVNDAQSWGSEISKQYYDVIYPAQSKDFGTYTLEIVFKDRYEGTISLDYTVTPDYVKDIKYECDVKGITYSWDKVPGATNYRIKVSSGGETLLTEDLPADITSFRLPSVYDDGLAQIETYYNFYITPYAKLSDGTVVESYRENNLSKKYIPAQSTYKAKEGTYKYFIADGKAVIVSADVKGDVVIPKTLGGYKTYEIMQRAFANLTDLKSVTIPEGVKILGEMVFSDSGVTKLSIPSTLTKMDNYALAYCKKLKSITVSEKNSKYYADENGILYNKAKTSLIIFPAKSKLTEFSVPKTVTKICGYAFAYNNTLKSVSVNEGVTVIGRYAFHCCKGLKSVSLPQSLEKINESAFRACTKLESDIVLSDKITRLPTYTFAFCSKLENITLPANIETISSKVFYKCGNLDNLIIPASVISIGHNAFYQCKKSMTIYYMGDPQTWPSVIGKYSTAIPYNARVHYNYADYVHELTPAPIIAPSCTDTGYGTYECPCGASYKDSIPALGHSYTTVYPTKATTKKDGISVSRCERCGYSETNEIYKVKVAFLSKKLIYNGKVNLPTVTLVSGKTLLIEDKDYNVIYSDENSTDMGSDYTVRFISTRDSAYDFDVSCSYSILPGETAKISLEHTTSSIKLTWKAVPGATGYRVYRYNYTDKKWEKIKSTTATSYTVKSLNSGTRYRFAVQAYHKTSQGDVYFSSSKVALTTSTKPATVENFLVSSAGKGKVSFSWKNISGESGFQIYYSTSKNGTYKKLADISANIVKHTKTGLTSGKTYYFKVRAYRTINENTVNGSFSGVKSIKVK